MVRKEMELLMTEPQPKTEIPEIPQADKPFYLAVLSMIALLVGIIFAIYAGAQRPDVYKDLWLQVSAVFSPFVMMSWAFYFKAKS